MGRMIERGGAKAWAGGLPADAGLRVDVTGIAQRSSGLEILGVVADSGPCLPWVADGAEAFISVNPVGTTFREGVLGQGRIYDDRIEVDLALDKAGEAALAFRLGEIGRGILVLHGEPIAGRLLRITGFDVS